MQNLKNQRQYLLFQFLDHEYEPLLTEPKMKSKFTSGVGLFFLSVYLMFNVLFFGTFLNIYVLFEKKFAGFWAYLGGLFKTLAIIIDITGNAVFGPALNRFFITKDSNFKFGKHNHTISEVLGVNQWNETLREPGKQLSKTLDYLDKQHCYNSIQKHNHTYLVPHWWKKHKR